MTRDRVHSSPVHTPNKLPGARYFSGGYASARQRFLLAAQAQHAKLHALPLAVSAPGGGALSVDIAWLGSSQPKHLVIHSSGLHGVEGFAGSAIQLALLNQELHIPSDAALILVHVLNPFGMAWSRRVNENNVDLNRNFSDNDDERSGVSTHYRRLHAFLNPPSPPASDWFYLRAAGLIARHGLTSLKQAIAEGQFEYPRGLFFGGKRLEPGPSLYQSWLARHVTGLQRGFAVDVHTGLGRWCQESLILHRAPAGDHGLHDVLGRQLTEDPTKNGVAYEVKGGYPRALDSIAGHPRLFAVMQEFGTYPSVRVLHALREENRWHHFGNGDVSHATKHKLLEMFAPRADEWRESVVSAGVSLAKAAMRYTFG